VNYTPKEIKEIITSAKKNGVSKIKIESVEASISIDFIGQDLDDVPCEPPGQMA